MPYTKYHKERREQIKADIDAGELGMDDMILKYNSREHFETMKSQDWIRTPAITKAEKRERARHEYGPRVKPNEFTPPDMWGARLPLFSNESFRIVNDRYKSLCGKKRRKPRRGITEKEIVKATSRPRLVEAARRAASGITPPESDATPSVAGEAAIDGQAESSMASQLGSVAEQAEPTAVELDAQEATA